MPVGVMGTIMPKPQRCDVGFGEPADLASYKGACLQKSSNRLFARGCGAAIFAHPEPRAVQLAAPAANPLSITPALPAPTVRVDAISP